MPTKSLVERVADLTPKPFEPTWPNGIPRVWTSPTKAYGATCCWTGKLVCSRSRSSTFTVPDVPMSDTSSGAPPPRNGGARSAPDRRGEHRPPARGTPHAPGMIGSCRRRSSALCVVFESRYYLGRRRRKASVRCPPPTYERGAASHRVLVHVRCAAVEDLRLARKGLREAAVRAGSWQCSRRSARGRLGLSRGSRRMAGGWIVLPQKRRLHAQRSEPGPVPVAAAGPGSASRRHRRRLTSTEHAIALASGAREPALGGGSRHHANQH